MDVDIKVVTITTLAQLALNNINYQSFKGEYKKQVIMKKKFVLKASANIEKKQSVINRQFWKARQRTIFYSIISI